MFCANRKHPYLCIYTCKCDLLPRRYIAAHKNSIFTRLCFARGIGSRLVSVTSTGRNLGQTGGRRMLRAVHSARHAAPHLLLNIAFVNPFTHREWMMPEGGGGYSAYNMRSPPPGRNDVRWFNFLVCGWNPKVWPFKWKLGAVLSCGTVYCGVQGDCNLKCDHSNESWAVFPLVFFIMLCQFAVVSVKKQKIVFVQFVSMLLKISYLKICLAWLQNYRKSFCFQICHYSILFNSISYTYVNYHLCLLFQCSYQWFYRR